MKRIISLALILAICLSALLLLTACGSGIPSGTYKGVMGDEFKVDGNKMKNVVEFAGESYSVVFTYEIDKNEKDEETITLTFEKVEYSGDNEIVKGVISEIEKGYANEASNTGTFEKGDGYFRINGVKYTKQ